MTPQPSPGVRAAPAPLARPALIGLAVIAAAAVALRAVAIHASWFFNQDGCSYLESAAAFRDGAVFARWSVRMLHPVYPALVALTSSVLPDMELAARVVSLVGSVATCAGVGWWWSRHRGAAEGLLVAALLAIHPGMVMYGSEILTEMVSLPLIFVLCVAVARAREEDLPLRSVAAIAALLAALTWVKSTAVFFAPGAVLAAAWPTIRSRRWTGLVRPAVAFAAVFLPIALAPYVLNRVATGSFPDLTGHEEAATDVYVLGIQDPAEIEGRSRAALTVLKWFTNLWRTLTWYVPRQLVPWWVVVPLVVIGLVVLLRDRGRAGSVTRVLAVVLAAEWACRFRYLMHDRYLIPSVLLFLPAAGAGALAVGRFVAARLGSPRLGAAATALAGAAVIGAWGWSFHRTYGPGPYPNSYREAGAALAAMGPARPASLVVRNPEIAWYAGSSRARTPGRTVDEVIAPAVTGTVEGVVVGPDECNYLRALDDARAVPVGSPWRGLVVIHRTRDVTVLARPDVAARAGR